MKNTNDLRIVCFYMSLFSLQRTNSEWLKSQNTAPYIQHFNPSGLIKYSAIILNNIKTISHNFLQKLIKYL